jgi:hypothetical protein
MQCWVWFIGEYALKAKANNTQDPTVMYPADRNASSTSARKITVASVHTMGDTNKGLYSLSIHAIDVLSELKM